MIHINRSDLRRLAEAFVLANTPYSLLRSLQNNETVRRLRTSCEKKELADYYDWLTVRARRSEFVMGLAYAVLVANLLHGDSGSPVDVTRLRWGPLLVEYLEKTGRPTQVTHIIMPADMSYYQDSGSPPTCHPEKGIIHFDLGEDNDS